MLLPNVLEKLPNVYCKGGSCQAFIVRLPCWLQFFIKVGKYYFPGIPSHHIFASTKAEMLEQLLQAGFPLDIIPEKLGGPWCYETGVQEWMAELAEEYSDPAAPDSLTFAFEQLNELPAAGSNRPVHD